MKCEPNDGKLGGLLVSRAQESFWRSGIAPVSAWFVGGRRNVTQHLLGKYPWAAQCHAAGELPSLGSSPGGGKRLFVQPQWALHIWLTAAGAAPAVRTAAWKRVPPREIPVPAPAGAEP